MGVEDSVSIKDLVKVAYWSISLGTRYLTFYYKNGRIKSAVDKFEYCLKNEEREVSGYHIKVNTPNRINGFTNGYKKSSLVNVNVLAPEDCRSDVINATKQLCHHVLRKKIEPSDINIGNFLES